MKKISKAYALALMRNETVVQAAKYFVVGGICTVIDFVLLFILTNNLGVNYIISSIISFMTGTILNYLLCILWIFEVRIVDKRHHEFLYYLLITGVGLGFNTLTIWLLTDIYSIHYMLSKLLATFITFWWNFLAGNIFYIQLNKTQNEKYLFSYYLNCQS